MRFSLVPHKVIPMTEQDSVQETERVDRYALDDTLAGRITQSLALGLMTSYPDWIKNKKALVAAYIGSFLGFGALVAVTNAQREQEEQQPVQAQEQEMDVKAWAAFVAVVLVLIVGGFINVKVAQAMVKPLRKRGVQKPWTTLGAIGAGLLFVVSELEARDIAKRAA